MNRLLIWCLDDVLGSTGGLSLDVLTSVVSEVLQMDVPLRNLDVNAHTDMALVKDLLIKNGFDGDELKGMLRRILRQLGPEMAKHREQLKLRAGLRDGAFGILERVHLDTSAISTVLSGRIAVNAVLQADSLRIAQFLDLEVGGFGGDGENFSALIEAILNRVDRKHGSIDPDDVWLIGTSHTHVELANSQQINCLVISSNEDDVLKSSGVEIVGSLTEIDRIWKLIFSD